MIAFEKNRKAKPKHTVLIGRFGKAHWREFLETPLLSEYEKDFALELFIERGLFTEVTDNIYEWKTESAEEDEW